MRGVLYKYLVFQSYMYSFDIMLFPEIVIFITVALGLVLCISVFSTVYYVFLIEELGLI